MTSLTTTLAISELDRAAPAVGPRAPHTVQSTGLSPRFRPADVLVGCVIATAIGSSVAWALIDADVGMTCHLAVKSGARA